MAPNFFYARELNLTDGIIEADTFFSWALYSMDLSGSSFGYIESLAFSAIFILSIELSNECPLDASRPFCESAVNLVNEQPLLNGIVLLLSRFVL